MGTRHFWTTNRTQITYDLWELGFEPDVIALVLGTDSPRSVSAKLAHLKRTTTINRITEERMRLQPGMERSDALLLAGAQLTGLSRDCLLDQHERLEDNGRELAVDLLNAFINATRFVANRKLDTPNSIIMRKRLKDAAELLQIRAQAVATTQRPPELGMPAIKTAARLMAFIDIIGGPEPGKRS